jgi:hypothetical protein
VLLAALSFAVKNAVYINGFAGVLQVLLFLPLWGYMGI